MPPGSHPCCQLCLHSGFWCLRRIFLPPGQSFQANRGMKPFQTQPAAAEMLLQQPLPLSSRCSFNCQRLWEKTPALQIQLCVIQLSF